MTSFHLNTRDLTPQFIEDLQKRFPSSDLEIQVGELPEPPVFTEKDFWEVLSCLDWSKEGDDEGVLQPAIHYLASFPLSGIYRFADLLSEKLWTLDTAAHANVFLKDEGSLSVDDFLYARCCVVANGKEAYEHVLTHPDKMPLDVTFESLLHLVSAAYRQKTGKDQLIIPAYNYETYSNRAGWGKE